jgi:hypothetical protein
VTPTGSQANSAARRVPAALLAQRAVVSGEAARRDEAEHEQRDPDERGLEQRLAPAALPRRPRVPVQREHVEEQHGARGERDDVEAEEDVDQGVARLPRAVVARRRRAARGQRDDHDRGQHAQCGQQGAAESRASLHAG